jgi:hypothetical protein
VVRSFVDQGNRAGNFDAETLALANKFIDRAERFAADGKSAAAKAQLRALADELEGDDFESLRDALRDLADSLP